MDQPPRVVGLGEALFDCFPDRIVLGGAPVNFAVHADRLLNPTGGSGTILSRVGSDALGRKLTDELVQRGIDTGHLQHDPNYPTGTVDVRLTDEGQPDYTITPDVAWDHLDFDERARGLAESCQAVCFGTLAQRSKPARSSIQSFLESAADAIRMLDINIRRGYDLAPLLPRSIELATVVKLNEHELPLAAEILGLTTSGQPLAQLEALLDEGGLDAVALTRGSEGTLLMTKQGGFEGEPGSFNPNPDADSVGAGDACGAGLVAGMLLGLDPRDIVTLANAMGAHVASCPGATPPLPDRILDLVRR
ncbi:PfkB family carbohydrate kinase [Mucisphaera calidilacus]|uniref:2-dehydro-3-deoxygluconokinase n=1 Tax=Mucisphaera calidilacus TaxID=2527982 RepID=A0A518BX44_9BACT|nr:PfkB family carbohydrate kinase [Mucisphaera calidilacus]QDU71541.1 2-dehydro-3-deoxygluconokinase [Mucisphaera calidilacus]